MHAFFFFSTFNSILQATLKIEGYSESLSTTSIVSGIWTTGYSLGSILGSTFGGILYEKVKKGHAYNQNFPPIRVLLDLYLHAPHMPKLMSCFRVKLEEEF